MKYRDKRSIALPWTVSLFAVALLWTLAAPGQKLDTAKATMGKNLYRAYCASCHGPAAHGDGPVAPYLKPSPPDLTRIRERRDGSFPVDELQRIIDGRQPLPGHGSSEMPVWGKAFRVAFGESDEEVAARIENLVQYLLSIQTK